MGGGITHIPFTPHSPRHKNARLVGAKANIRVMCLFTPTALSLTTAVAPRSMRACTTNPEPKTLPLRNHTHTRTSVCTRICVLLGGGRIRKQMRVSLQRQRALPRHDSNCIKNYGVTCITWAFAHPLVLRIGIDVEQHEMHPLLGREQ